MTTLVVDREIGQRLDLWLAGQSGQTRSQAQRLIKLGLVSINGTVGKASYAVESGDVLIISDPVRPEPLPPELPVIYEDDDLLVVDKPADLSVHPGNTLSPEATVADFARLHTTDDDPERPGIVHRLDRDTSGLLVLAKSSAAKQQLQAIWKDRRVKKTYLLLAIGRVEPEAAVIDLPVGRDPNRPTRRAILPGAKQAVTRYRTLANFAGYSLIEAKPETGRTHQLRVHFAALGHPIAGDVVYGPSQRPLGLRRQFLHAARLELDTPKGEHLDLESPLPPDLRFVLDQLTGSA